MLTPERLTWRRSSVNPRHQDRAEKILWSRMMHRTNLEKIFLQKNLQGDKMNSTQFCISRFADTCHQWIHHIGNKQIFSLIHSLYEKNSEFQTRHSRYIKKQWSQYNLRHKHPEKIQTYVGNTYLDKSTSPGGVVIRSSICPEAVWNSTCIFKSLLSKTETFNSKYGASHDQFGADVQTLRSEMAGDREESETKTEIEYI